MFIVVNSKMEQVCTSWGMSDEERARKGLNKLNYTGTRPNAAGQFASQEAAEKAAGYLISIAEGTKYHVLKLMSTATLPSVITPA